MQLHGSRFKSITDCGLHILRTEGFRAFYISYPTTLSMTIPFQSIHFATYEYFRRILNPAGGYDPGTHIVAGGLAGGIAAATTTPLDVVKTLLQTKGTSTDSEVRAAKGMMGSCRLIYSRFGASGFFRGLLPRVMTHTPSTAICWSTVCIRTCFFPILNNKYVFYYT
jgi:solute carrier family 25 (mitochondrial iron transporter), member 28/37